LKSNPGPSSGFFPERVLPEEYHRDSDNGNGNPSDEELSMLDDWAATLVAWTSK
jgi:hypothetical protein